jgi:hypothetical protein
MKGTVVRDSDGCLHYVTWCDGMSMRLTPENGDPLESNFVAADFSEFVVVSGADWLERMISICAP